MRIEVLRDFDVEREFKVVA
jgi:hypothetical protein